MTTVAGPVELDQTEPEKKELAMDSETFLASLSQKDNETRKKIIYTMCEGVYGLTGLEDTLDTCLDALLQLCHNDKSLLSKMLMTPFIEGQTPFGWIIRSFRARGVLYSADTGDCASDRQTYRDL
ncbi:hypothetical protein CC2G_009563 [Coprinopsis cinerea AmutBmut pab1-1]|nr:hypothetical protein CC2G_009563 [Coprinopsis cinerea AmutBmut pab1-1]